MQSCVALVLSPLPIVELSNFVPCLLGTLLLRIGEGGLQLDGGALALWGTWNFAKLVAG